jgi:nitronate monooxygenase
MKITELFGIRLPIIQAPMAGVQAGAMAIAVSNAGGLGSLPCAVLTPEGLRKELDLIKARSDKPYNVNFFCHADAAVDPARESKWREALAPHYQHFGIDAATIPTGAGRAPFSEEFADVLEPYRPPVVSFHFGLPSAQLLARVKSWGSKIVSSATTVDEAGGHRGIFLSDDLTTQVGTFALLPQVIRAVKSPVIAAGGIADAQGVAAAMALGAAGVQLGTAYLLCPESLISNIHRQALKSNAARHTALTNIFTGRPARGIVNKVMREMGAINPLAPAFPLATSAIAPLRAKAEAQGLGDFTPLWSGQNATGCKEIPAGDLTKELAAKLL